MRDHNGFLCVFVFEGAGKKSENEEVSIAFYKLSMMYYD